MRKFNYFCSIVYVITMALMIVILSSNLILRTSATYTYHFNDSEALNKIMYSVKSDDMSKGIASYFSSFSSEKFQIYEKNGEYEDPIFKSDEQNVMKKVKNILNIELLVGVCFLIITILIYVYMVKQKYVLALRNRFRVGVILTVIITIGQVVFLSIKGARNWLYNTFIGIDLGKKDTLTIILGDPFYKTFLIFSTVIIIVILCIFSYINHKYTKPERIFY